MLVTYKRLTIVSAGPIVRISPYEVHIKDPDFCVEAFSPVKKLDKYGWWYRVFGGPGATVSTEHHDVHRSRRATFKNLLSPVAVRGFVPTILEKVKQAGLIMSHHAQMGRPVNMSNLYRCIAADTVSAYALPASLNLLDSEDLGEEFQSGLRLFFEAATTMRFLGFLQPLMMMMPDIIFRRLLTNPAKSLIKLIRVSNSRFCHYTLGQWNIRIDKLIRDWRLALMRRSKSHPARKNHAHALLNVSIPTPTGSLGPSMNVYCKKQSSLLLLVPRRPATHYP